MQTALEKTVPSILAQMEANMAGEFYAGEVSFKCRIVF